MDAARMSMGPAASAARAGIVSRAPAEESTALSGGSGSSDRLSIGQIQALLQAGVQLPDALRADIEALYSAIHRGQAVAAPTNDDLPVVAAATAGPPATFAANSAPLPEPSPTTARTQDTLPVAVAEAPTEDDFQLEDDEPLMIADGATGAPNVRLDARGCEIRETDHGNGRLTREELVDIYILQPMPTAGRADPNITDVSIIAPKQDRRRHILACYLNRPISYTFSASEASSRKRIQSRRDAEVVRVKKQALRSFLAQRSAARRQLVVQQQQQQQQQQATGSGLPTAGLDLQPSFLSGADHLPRPALAGIELQSSRPVDDDSASRDLRFSSSHSSAQSSSIVSSSASASSSSSVASALRSNVDLQGRGVSHVAPPPLDHSRMPPSSVGYAAPLLPSHRRALESSFGELSEEIHRARAGSSPPSAAMHWGPGGPRIMDASLRDAAGFMVGPRVHYRTLHDHADGSQGATYRLGPSYPSGMMPAFSGAAGPSFVMTSGYPHAMHGPIGSNGGILPSAYMSSLSPPPPGRTSSGSIQHIPHFPASTQASPDLLQTADADTDAAAVNSFGPNGWPSVHHMSASRQGQATYPWSGSGLDGDGVPSIADDRPTQSRFPAGDRPAMTTHLQSADRSRSVSQSHGVSSGSSDASRSLHRVDPDLGLPIAAPAPNADLPFGVSSDSSSASESVSLRAPNSVSGFGQLADASDVVADSANNSLVPTVPSNITASAAKSHEADSRPSQVAQSSLRKLLPTAPLGRPSASATTHVAPAIRAVDTSERPRLPDSGDVVAPRSDAYHLVDRARMPLGHRGGAALPLHGLTGHITAENALAAWVPPNDVDESADIHLRRWIFAPEHVVHPYPSSSEVVDLSNETGLSIRAVERWFAKARSQLWGPLVQGVLEGVDDRSVPGDGDHAGSGAARSSSSSRLHIHASASLSDVGRRERRRGRATWHETARVDSSRRQLLEPDPPSDDSISRSRATDRSNTDEDMHELRRDAVHASGSQPGANDSGSDHTRSEIDSEQAPGSRSANGSETGPDASVAAHAGSTGTASSDKSHGSVARSSNSPHDAAERATSPASNVATPLSDGPRRSHLQPTGELGSRGEHRVGESNLSTSKHAAAGLVRLPGEPAPVTPDLQAVGSTGAAAEVPVPVAAHSLTTNPTNVELWPAAAHGSRIGVSPPDAASSSVGGSLAGAGLGTGGSTGESTQPVVSRKETVSVGASALGRTEGSGSGDALVMSSLSARLLGLLPAPERPAATRLAPLPDSRHWGAVGSNDHVFQRGSRFTAPAVGEHRMPPGQPAGGTTHEPAFSTNSGRSDAMIPAPPALGVAMGRHGLSADEYSRLVHKYALAAAATAGSSESSWTVRDDTSSNRSQQLHGAAKDNGGSSSVSGSSGGRGGSGSGDGGDGSGSGSGSLSNEQITSASHHGRHDAERRLHPTAARGQHLVDSRHQQHVLPAVQVAEIDADLRRRHHHHHRRRRHEGGLATPTAGASADEPSDKHVERLLQHKQAGDNPLQDSRHPFLPSQRVSTKRARDTETIAPQATSDEADASRPGMMGAAMLGASGSTEGGTAPTITGAPGSLTASTSSSSAAKRVRAPDVVSSP